MENTMPSVNPDMQGYVVRLACFVTHAGAAILIAWSKKTPRSCYGLVLSQVIFVMIGVLVCIRRDQLTTNDARFAVILCRSPTCIYIGLLVIPRLFLQQSKRVNYFDRICAVAVLALWTAMNISVRFEGKAYTTQQCETEQCKRLTSGPGRATAYRHITLGISSIVLYECVLARHHDLRRKIIQRLAFSDSSIKKSFFLKRRDGFSTTWYIALQLHPWIPFCYALVMFEDWAWKMDIWKIEKDYNFSYGQFLALSPVIPIIFECAKLMAQLRSEIVNLPRRFAWDVLWILTGKGKPWCGDDSDLMDVKLLSDVWDTFPQDMPPPQPELPFCISN